jgi:hypothetical protein
MREVALSGPCEPYKSPYYKSSTVQYAHRDQKQKKKKKKKKKKGQKKMTFSDK